jgi:hypothetical protein
MLNILGPVGARMDRKSAYHVDIDRQLRQGAPHPVSLDLDYVDPQTLPVGPSVPGLR